MNPDEPARPQEWTLRLVALGSIVSLAIIGVVCTYTAPASPGIVTSIVNTLSMIAVSAVGAKAALSVPSTPKVQ